MLREFLNPAEAAPPIGPYSHVVRINLGTADLLVVSGQLATDLENPDIVAQTRGALEQVRLVLEGVGASLADVIKVTTFLTELGGREELRATRREAFPTDLPASTTVQVAGLMDPRAKVEVEVLAVIPRAAQAS